MEHNVLERFMQLRCHVYILVTQGTRALEVGMVYFQTRNQSLPVCGNN